jgi:hypothetical protein
VRLDYRHGGFPRVGVLSPALESRLDQPLPHFYREGVLCLHLEGEWHPDMFLATTTLPWASEWLVHYEIWLATGVWYGGGAPLPLDVA